MVGFARSQKMNEYVPVPQIPITAQQQFVDSYGAGQNRGRDFYAFYFAEEAWMPSEEDLRKTYHDDRGAASHFWNKANAATLGQIGKVPDALIMPNPVPKFPVPHDYAFGDVQAPWWQPTYYS